MFGKTIKVTLIRSHIGLKPKLAKTLIALGLRRPHAAAILPDTAAVRQMVRVVGHLVRVEPA